MGAADRPPAERDRTDDDPLDTQLFEGEAGAHDVDDRVDTTDLVEMDISGVDAVDVGFGPGELAEDREGSRSYPFGQRCLFDDGHDVDGAPVRLVAVDRHRHVGGRDSMALRLVHLQ